MRSKGKKHYFIDACAGSGIVQECSGKRILNGSPLIFAKTREKVEQTIRDKTKKPELQCKFIENNKKRNHATSDKAQQKSKHQNVISMYISM